MAELTGQPQVSRPSRPPLREWLLRFIDWEGDPRAWLDTLPGVLLHLSDAWARRHRPNVVLVHYDDLLSDLDGTMRRLSGLLGIAVDEARWPALVHAATFDAMRARLSAPDGTLGVLKDPAAFFRHGASGDGRGAPDARASSPTTAPASPPWRRPTCWPGSIATSRREGRSSRLVPRREAARSGQPLNREQPRRSWVQVDGGVRDRPQRRRRAGGGDRSRQRVAHRLRLARLGHDGEHPPGAQERRDGHGDGVGRDGVQPGEVAFVAPAACGRPRRARPP